MLGGRPRRNRQEPLRVQYESLAHHGRAFALIHRLCCRGLGDDALRWKNKPVPEAAGGYPDAHMFGHALPAYGLYARHVDGLLLENCSFSLAEGSSDAREPVVMEDVTPHVIAADAE